MSLLVLVLLAAVAVGWARHGSLDRLGTLPVRSRRLVLLAFAAQLIGTLVGGPFHPVGLVLSAALVVAFLSRNRRVRGTGLIALGLLANALVVGANGAMPVSTRAAALADVDTGRIARGDDARHELSGSGTRLPWLADVVPVAFPPRPEVVSPGDVLVTAGAAQLVVTGMLRRPARAPGSGPPLGAGQPRPARPGQPTGRQRRALPPLPPTDRRPARRSASPPGRSPTRPPAARTSPRRPHAHPP